MRGFYNIHKTTGKEHELRNKKEPAADRFF